MWEKLIEYFRNNPAYFYIAVAIIAVLLLLVIILIITKVKKSKRKKAAALTEQTFEPIPAPDKKEQSISKESSSSYKEQIRESGNQTASEKTETSSETQNITPFVYEEKPNEPNGQAEANDTTDAAAENVPVGQPQINAGSAATKRQDTPPKADAVAEAATIQQDDSAKKAQPKAAPRNNEQRSERKTPEDKQEVGNDNKTTDAAHVATRSAAEKLLTVNARDEEDRKNAYSGKWVIRKIDTGTFFFELRASNGEKLLSSIEYTSLSGAKNGIKTHKTNIQKNNIVISQSKNGLYFFKLLNGSKQLLCTGETYPSKSGCESAVESVKRFADTAIVTVIQENEEE